MYGKNIYRGVNSATLRGGGDTPPAKNAGLNPNLHYDKIAPPVFSITRFLLNNRYTMPIINLILKPRNKKAVNELQTVNNGRGVPNSTIQLNKKWREIGG